MDYSEAKRVNSEKIRAFEESPGEGFDGSVDFSPRFLQIEHTSRCNARCIMCNHLYSRNLDASDVDIRVLHALKEILPYVETVMMNGDGEPFLYNRINESIELFSEYGIEIGTNTNLSVIPDSVWDHIADGFAFLNISCDGSTRELYEKIRKDLSYDVFIENLKRLNHIAPDLMKHMDVVLMRQNLHDMQGLVELAAEYGFASIRFHMLGVNPIIGNSKDSPDLYMHTMKCNIEKAAKAAEICGIKTVFPAVSGDGNDSPQTELEKMAAEEINAEKRIKYAEQFGSEAKHRYQGIDVSEDLLLSDQYMHGQMCRWAIERCYIDIRGNMTTCCYDVDHSYGNLLEQSFNEIWNGDLYRKLRIEMSKGRLPSWCRKCMWIQDPYF